MDGSWTAGLVRLGPVTRQPRWSLPRCVSSRSGKVGCRLICLRQDISAARSQKSRDPADYPMLNGAATSPAAGPFNRQHHSNIKPVICSTLACTWLCITIAEPHQNTHDLQHGTTCVDSHNCPNTGNRIVHLSGFATPNQHDDI